MGIPSYLPQDYQYDWVNPNAALKGQELMQVASARFNDKVARANAGRRYGMGGVPNPAIYGVYGMGGSSNIGGMSNLPAPTVQSNYGMGGIFGNYGMSMDVGSGTEEPTKSVSYDRPEYAQDAKALLDDAGLAAYIRSGRAGNGADRVQHLLGLGYSPEQIAAAQALVNRSIRRTPLPVKTAPVAAAPTVTSVPKPEAQLAASLFKARQQSARNALGGLSPAEGVQRGIIPYEALAYF